MEKKSRKINKGSPYQKVIISPDYENSALEILYGIGIPFEHVGIRQYRITTDMCKLLSRKKIQYEHLD